MGGSVAGEAVVGGDVAVVAVVWECWGWIVVVEVVVAGTMVCAVVVLGWEPWMVATLTMTNRVRRAVTLTLVNIFHLPIQTRTCPAGKKTIKATTITQVRLNHGPAAASPDG